ncbi:MAG TPA: prolyl oligopeptidase family serine peptidase [Solirubrobacteraceae bacterium]|nr:prolyl oligopeptidase family serine peptidase [Solirubrobacteraceae bacterium]
MRLPIRGRGWCAILGVSACFGAAAPVASAGVPNGMPTDVPPAASQAPATLPEPTSTAWPFPNSFPQTSGTGRLAGGASLWSDFIYDDYGATSLPGAPTSSYDQSSDLSPRHGDYVFPSGPANNNGADIFRAGVGVKGNFSYWRVDWVTLADPSVPIAEWTFDTDNNSATGVAAWPAGAGVSSPGIDQALVVSSRGAWLVNPLTGLRTDVVANGGSLTVDRAAKSFIVAVPRSLLPVSGIWRVRLAAGLADASGQNFAAPYVGNTSSPSTTAERVYNITFRSVDQEPPIWTDNLTATLAAAAQQALGATPIGAALGAGGIVSSVKGNFWMENDQADTLAGGDVSKFSLLVDWSQLGAATTTPEPQPTGYSTRWYVSSLSPGSGQVVNDGNEGNFKPTLLERIQPYAVYVPTTYRPGQATPLTWILHSLEVNYNQYGAFNPQLIQQLCQDRGSICATTEGFGPAGWYFNEADTDFWQVWRALAQNFTLDPERTVISGYSMGGWASYKLAFEHPDDFAGAFSMDGPVVCGIEFYPGENGNAFSDPACSQDGQSKPLIANARWIPYVMDHTYADELVPVQGVISQAQVFDQLGQRYDLFIHTGGDHLAFSTEDRFGDAVAAVGTPVRTVNPGSFSYSWYPSLDSTSLGIGATGDYWLSGFAARDRAFGKIATIKATDEALPDRAVTPQRSGPSLVTQPIPGTETRLTWQLGRRPTAHKRMTLDLTDVSGLTLDSLAANLRLGTITLHSDGASQFRIVNLQNGTEVLEHGRVVARAGRGGTVSVGLRSGTTVLKLVRPGHAARNKRARSHRHRSGSRRRRTVRFTG